MCILEEDCSIIEKRIRTLRERFAEVFGGRPKARILVESSTESEWVARCLESLGHEVVVADPNFSPMYATRSRKVKTDKRDARTLAEACRLGAYKAAHRTSDERRHRRAQLAAREVLVRTRTRLISLMRSLLRREGIHVGTGSAAVFQKRMEAVELPDYMSQEVAPLLAMMEPLNSQIAALDAQLQRVAESDAHVALLCTAPQIGPVTASAFASAVDKPERFSNPPAPRSSRIWRRPNCRMRARSSRYAAGRARLPTESRGRPRAGPGRRPQPPAPWQPNPAAFTAWCEHSRVVMTLSATGTPSARRRHGCAWAATRS